MWIIQPLEIADDEGKPTGKWRMTATSDEDGGGPHPLCECEDGHASATAASGCSEARERKKTFGL